MTRRLLFKEGACLSCDGCCRFAEKSSAWAPVFLFDEIEVLTSQGLLPPALFTHEGSHAGEAARINLVEKDGHYVCPCYDLETHMCAIYSQRPFDCQLYPFLLAKSDQQIFLGVDIKCPQAQELLDTDHGRAVVRSLGDFFNTKDTLRWLKKNRILIQEYPAQDLKIITPLPQLTLVYYGPASSHLKR